jgi:hypothetical protein
MSFYMLAWLQEKGYNGTAFKVKANVRPNTLHNTCIAQASTAEEHVKATVAGRIPLSSLLYNWTKLHEC